MLESPHLIKFLPGLGRRQEVYSRWTRICLGKSMELAVVCNADISGILASRTSG